MSESVCAFVLTRNRKHLLVECLRALLGQTHPLAHLLVLDNASEDGTRELLDAEGLLDEPRLSYHRLEHNRGGAGGYAEGVRLARATEVDWIWLMDDDSEPALDALERLLSAPPAADPRTAVLCGSVVHSSGEIELLHRCSYGHFIRPLPEVAYAGAHYPLVDCASFVGFLIRAPVARALELPRAEFFITYDDAEYSLRARRHGAIRLVPESVMTHKTHTGGGATTRRTRFMNRLLGQHYTSVAWTDLWRNLYAVRNFMRIRHEHGRVGRLAFCNLTAAYMLKALIYDPEPFRRLPWIARYALRGRRGDFSGPTPEEWSASFSRGRARYSRAARRDRN